MEGHNEAKGASHFGLPKWVSEGVLTALIPVGVYILALSFESGRLLYYSAPLGLVEVGPSNVLEIVLTLITALMPGIFASGIVLNRLQWFQARLWEFVFVAVSCVLLWFMFQWAAGTPPLIEGYLPAVVLLWLATSRTIKRRKQATSSEFVDYHPVYSGIMACWLIIIALIFPSVSAGIRDARLGGKHYLLQGSDNRVAFAFYKDRVLVSEFDPKTLTLSNEFEVLAVPGDNGRRFRIEELGRLVNPRMPEGLLQLNVR